VNQSSWFGRTIEKMQNNPLAHTAAFEVIDLPLNLPKHFLTSFPVWFIIILLLGKCGLFGGGYSRIFLGRH
jgi:hypothetical protein